MAQQITIQPPHEDKAELEYEKGGRFKLSGRGTLALLIIIILLALLYWTIDWLL